MSMSTEKKPKKSISDNPKFSHFFTYLSRDHRAMSQVGPKMTYVPKYKQNETFGTPTKPFCYTVISDSH